MPKLYNGLAHAIRVTDSDGRQHRLRAGEVRNVDGEAADMFNEIDGVDTANSDQEEAWADQQTRLNGTVNDVDGGKMSMDAALTEARVAARHIAVATPLNQVIGDNDAPMGPPSGVITTKQAVARTGVREKMAYADHERLPEEAQNEGLGEVERAQAEAKALVESLHKEVLEEAQERGNEAVDLAPQSEGTLATDGLEAVVNEGAVEQVAEETTQASPRRRGRKPAAETATSDETPSSTGPGTSGRQEA